MRGFTLVEMLVATAVFVMLLLAVSALVGSTSALTSTEQRRMEADAHARQVFDRMALDFADMVKRRDVDFLFRSNPGNDQMAFYSESTGYFPDNISAQQKGTVSLIGYMVDTGSDSLQPRLVRLSKGLPWSGVNSSGSPSAMIYGTSSLPGQVLTQYWPKIVDGSDPDFQVVSDLVYRMEFNFLLKSYLKPDGTRAPAVFSVTPWDVRQSHTQPQGLRDVSAIVVAISILDSASRKLVAPEQFPEMTRALPDATGTTMLKSWANSGYISQTKIPAAAASQIRIYQRCFYLDSAP